MTDFNTGFTQAAGKRNLGLDLMVADTRQGMDAATQHAFEVVKAQSVGNPRRTAYVERFAAAAGGGRRATTAPRASANTAHM